MTKRAFKPLGAASALSLMVLCGCSPDYSVTGDAVKKYQSAGMAWKREDFPKKEALLPKENAAPLLEEAFQAWNKARKGRDPSLSHYALTAAEAKKSLADLKGYERALDLDVTASKLPGYDPGWDPDVDYGMVVPEMLSLRSLVRGLCLRAEASAIAGKVSEGLNDWEASVRLTLLTRGLPDACAQVHAAGFSLTSSRTAVKIAHAAGDSVEAVESLAAGLALLNEEPDWRALIKMDGYPTLAAMRNANSESDAQSRLWMVFPKDDDFRSAVVREGGPKSRDLNKAFREVMDFYTQVGAAMALPDARLEGVINTARDLEIRTVGNEGFLGSSFLSSSLSRVAAAMGHARAAWAVVSLMQLQLSGGGAKGGFSALGKKITTDPLTDQPLGSSFGKGRFKAWSVGADFRSDGGLSRADLIGSSSQASRVRSGFDESAELPHPMAANQKSPRPFAPVMPSAVMVAPGAMPSVTKGTGVRHELPPAAAGMGALAIRRDVGLGDAF